MHIEHEHRKMNIRGKKKYCKERWWIKILQQKELFFYSSLEYIMRWDDMRVLSTLACFATLDLQVLRVPHILCIVEKIEMFSI